MQTALYDTAGEGGFGRCIFQALPHLGELLVLPTAVMSSLAAARDIMSPSLIPGSFQKDVIFGRLFPSFLLSSPFREVKSSGISRTTSSLPQHVSDCLSRNLLQLEAVGTEGKTVEVVQSGYCIPYLCPSPQTQALVPSPCTGQASPKFSFCYKR